MDALLESLLLFAAAYLAQYDLPLPATAWSDHPVVKEAKVWPKRSQPYGITQCGTRQSTGEAYCFVVLNKCLRNKPSFAKKVILHEMAHYVDYMTDGHMEDHRGHWVEIMRAWGQTPAPRALDTCY